MQKHNFYFQIDEFIVDPDLLEISQNKQKVKVQNKVIEVLLNLIEAKGQLVTKKELNEKVWKDTIVTENSLNKAISEIRKIFNDSRTAPKYIETIPKKGYRFIRDYKKISKLKKSTFDKLAPVLLFLFILTISFSDIIIENVIYRNTKITSTLSPDGKMIAYFYKENNDFSLLVKDVVLQKVNNITSIPKPESFIIAWSPDNNALIYNATVKENPYFSINVVDLKTNHTTYIKFAKNPEKHKTESLPSDFNAPTEYVDHSKLKMDDNDIHHIYLTEKDTIKVLFEKGIIKSFNW